MVQLTQKRGGNDRGLVDPNNGLVRCGRHTDIECSRKVQMSSSTARTSQGALRHDGSAKLADFNYSAQIRRTCPGQRVNVRYLIY